MILRSVFVWIPTWSSHNCGACGKSRNPGSSSSREKCGLACSNSQERTPLITPQSSKTRKTVSVFGFSTKCAQCLCCSMSLTAINGRQKRHILADKQEHSRSIAAVLKQHNLAESAKIGHNLAERPERDILAEAANLRRE